MARKKLADEMAESGGLAGMLSNKPTHKMSDEEIQQAVFDNRQKEGITAAERRVSRSRRAELLKDAGYDWFNIDDLTPHPDNAYAVTKESVESLAELMYVSGHIEPLLLRKLPDTIQIIDGERRWRARKLLAEKYGESWKMVPAQCFELGECNDEKAILLLHSGNIGQRDMTPSERANGYAAVADYLTVLRKTDADFREKYKNVKLRTILAKQFNKSESSIANGLAISRNLPETGKELLDEKQLTQNQAASIARLPEEQRENVISHIVERKLSSPEVDEIISIAKHTDEPLKEALASSTIHTERKAKDVNAHLKSATRALKKATNSSGSISLALIGEIKDQLRILEDQYNEER